MERGPFFGKESMSISKRVWIEADPQYKSIRDQHQQAALDHLSEFMFRLPLRRRGKPGRPYWDSAWPYCVQEAIAKLGLETVQLNSGLYFRNQCELDEAKSLAEELFLLYQANSGQSGAQGAVRTGE